jgi:cation:H+ antiporter
MHIITTIAFILIGGGLLFCGGDWLVTGASSLARKRGISRLTIGLTIVAFGTSAPEFFTSLIAALRDVPSISIGNVIGSNITNIALILGLAALIFPPKIAIATIRIQIPFAIVGTAAFTAVILNGTISRPEALAMLLFFTAFIIYCMYSARDVILNNNGADTHARSTAWREALYIIFGLAFLIGGSELFIRGAVRLAEIAGVSEYMVGLTVVAVGTSLPELATSITAAIKKESEILVGNIIGSNVFNILFIMGFVGLIRPLSVSGISMTIDTILMLGLTVLLFPMLYTGRRLSRPEGSILVAIYVAYIIYIAMRG